MAVLMEEDAEASQQLPPSEVLVEGFAVPEVCTLRLKPCGPSPRRTKDGCPLNCCERISCSWSAGRRPEPSLWLPLHSQRIAPLCC